MTTFEYLNKNAVKIKELVLAGFISPHVLRDVMIYESYLRSKYNTHKAQNITNLSLDYMVSEKTVRRALNNMSEVFVDKTKSMND